MCAPVFEVKKKSPFYFCFKFKINTFIDLYLTSFIYFMSQIGLREIVRF